MREPTGCRVLIWLAVSCALATGAPERARANVTVATVEPAAPTALVPELLLAQLLQLAPDVCEVRYVPGTLDRAAHVELSLRRLTQLAARRTRQPARLVALVLPREEWQQTRLGCPYGIPCRAGTRVLAVPASGDAGTVALWRGLLGELPVLAGTPLMGTAEEAASLAPADSLAGLLAARELVAAAGFAADEPWVADLLAHALQLDAARQERSGRAEDLASFWAALRRHAAATPPASGSLAGELVQQARLFLAAEAVLGSAERFPARSLHKLQKKGGGVLRAADLRAAWPVELGGL